MADQAQRNFARPSAGLSEEKMAIKHSGNSRTFRAFMFAVLLMIAVPSLWAKTGTTTLLNASSNVVAGGTPVTLTATVSSGGTPLSAGLVVFCDATAVYCEDSAIIGSVWMTKSGTAVVHKTFGPGPHHIAAQFKGTASFAASVSGTTLITVTSAPQPTNTTISSTGTAGNYVLTATVTSSGPPAPTGSVSFLDTSNGNFQLASAPVGAAQVTSSFVSAAGPLAVYENQAIAVGDFNNNGNLDYVIANLDSPSTATIMVGNGNGTFTKGASYSAGAYPEGAVVADFNGDGNLDIAFANSSSSGVTVLLGNGDGTFTAAAQPAVAYASSIAVGDFNGDGIPDLAVANNDGNYQVTILFGNGDGTFTVGPSTPIPAWSVNPEGIVAMDFNGDGNTDLAVTSANTYSPASYVVTILLGNGDGTFVTGQSYTTGTSGISIAAGDFTGTGVPSLAIANAGDNTVTILLGNGNGTFTPGATVSTQSVPLAIVTGDFNNDGKLDFATANFGSSSVQLFLGNGDGTFTASSPWPITGSGADGIMGSGAVGGGPDGIVAADFKGAGLMDFITANYWLSGATVTLQSETYTAAATASGVSAWGSGTHAVIGSYSGDSNYQGSSSSAAQLTGTPVATPIMSLASGTYPAGQTLTISDTNPLATIYYTLNGTPTTSSTKYNGAITLNNSETISAIAAIGTTAVSSVATITVTVNSLYLSPTTLNFGNVGVGVTSAAQTVDVYNNSGGTLSLSIPATVTAGSVGSFSTTTTPGNCGISLANNRSCYFTVTFTPTSTGTVPSGTTLNVQAGTTTLPLTLTGTGVTSALQLNYTALHFGNVAEGTSKSITVYLTNHTANPVTVSPGFASGSSPAYSIGTSTCPTTTPLAVDAECSFAVVFSPTTTYPGLQTGTLTVSSIAGSPTASIDGTGIANALVLNYTALHFGNVAEGTSKSITVYLMNYTTNPVTVSPGFAGSSSPAYSIGTSTCPTTTPLAVDAECSFAVVFSPTTTSPGLQTGTLTVSSTAGSPTASIDGTGMANALVLNYTALHFYNVAEGTSKSITVSLTNYTTGAVTVSPGFASGSSPAYSIGTSTCPTTTPLAVDASCSFTVVFSPTAAYAGLQTGTLTVSSIAGSPTASIDGTGMANALVMDYTALHFGNVAEGTSKSITVWLTNYTTDAVTVSPGFASGSSPAYSIGISTCPTTTPLAVDASCSFAVVFSPTTTYPGLQTGTLTVSSIAGSPTASIDGTGH